MTKDIKLSRLKSVALRTVWEDESKDFTPWLAEDQNLALLGEAIGMELKLENTEQKVGPFYADIVCKNLHDGSQVVIENQINKSDHKHLGQILTYATGLEAMTAVWIARQLKNEHCHALEWLNYNTGDSIYFFGIEIELWQIDDSLPAPKFNMVVRPQNWSEKISQQAQNNEGFAFKIQQEYWPHIVKRLEDLEDKETQLKAQKSKPSEKILFLLEKQTYLIAGMDTIKNCIRIELKIPQKRKEELLSILEEHWDEIEKNIGTKLDKPREYKEEQPDESMKDCFITQFKDNTDPTNRSDWDNQHNWLIERLLAFERVFRNYVK